jgi:hypothetical protein
MADNPESGLFTTSRWPSYPETAETAEIARLFSNGTEASRSMNWVNIINLINVHIDMINVNVSRSDQFERFSLLNLRSRGILSLSREIDKEEVEIEIPISVITNGNGSTKKH